MRVQIPSKRLEAVMSVISVRDLPETTRTAVRLVVEQGFSYEMAATRTGVGRKRISLAVRKINEFDSLLLKAYRLDE